MLQRSETLAEIIKNEPGRYLTDEEHNAVLRETPQVAHRLDAMRFAQRIESDVVQATVTLVLRKYDFENKHGYGKEKCYRDVTMVYRWCVFAMVADDLKMLDNKLLLWLRKILQSFQFPGLNDSIRLCYGTLRKEAIRQLPPDFARLLDPFLAAAEETLPS